MQLKTILPCAATAVLVSAAFLTVAATRPDHHEPETKQAAGEMAMDDEMMQAYLQAGQPGDMHEPLKHFVGEWDVEAEFDMDGEMVKSQGKAVAETIYGGRFIRETFSGEMMGEQFEGQSIVGYDNVGRKYQSVWYDMMSTALYYAEGTVSADGKTMTFTGMGPDPLTGSMKPYLHVHKVESPDKHVFEMYDSGDDGMKKSATMTYTRSK